MSIFNKTCSILNIKHFKPIFDCRDYIVLLLQVHVLRFPGRIGFFRMRRRDVCFFFRHIEFLIRVILESKIIRFFFDVFFFNSFHLSDNFGIALCLLLPMINFFLMFFFFMLYKIILLENSSYYPVLLRRFKRDLSILFMDLFMSILISDYLVMYLLMANYFLNRDSLCIHITS